MSLASQLSEKLVLLGQPVRLQILFVIAEQEACVCHLEAVLGLRQASISQHLMCLRKHGVVQTHREGRNIYYRLAYPGIMDTLRRLCLIFGLNYEEFASLSVRPIPGCPCPQCNPEMDLEYSCQNLHPASK